MYSFTKKEQIFILSIILVVLSIFGYKLIVENKTNSIKAAEIQSIKDRDISSENLPTIENTQESTEDKTIMVHISGQIYNPGLLELQSGDRINDAVELSGGLKNDADIDRINLSKKVQDEEKIYIPKIGEEIEQIQMVESISNSDSGNSEASDGKININNCNKELLISLPGIGEVTAEKIIKYREEFKFQKIEDLMQVSGIGDKKFQAIKDLITVK